MTNREAITVLTGFACSGNIQGNHDLIEAMKKAIDALGAQDRPIICPRCGRTFSEAEGNPWWIVYKELSGNRLLMGHYDARNGADEHFMYGIGTVMESIAVRCGMQEQWNNEFYANMVESEAKAER